MFKRSLLIIVFLFCGIFPLEADEKVLSLDEFTTLATQNDTEFETILIDELSIQYQKALSLPAKDLVLSIKQQHEFYFDQDRDAPDTAVSLSKLFPMTGTQLGLSYEAGTSLSSASTASKLSFSITQPIAQNAFGKMTRLLDKIVGLENEVASHQIVEAYEDYMATVLKTYYDWYEAYENLKVGQSSYDTNAKLLDDVYSRQKQRIALPIDVNKVKLQVMSKEERLIELEQEYKNTLNIIEKIMRYEGDVPLVPVAPRVMDIEDKVFSSSFETFEQGSRTFRILRMLEQKSTLAVQKDAQALLPSLDLLAGYQVSGSKYTIEDEKNFFYAGAQMDWPFGHQGERAKHELSKIAQKRVELSTQNTYYHLYTQLLNLNLQIEREKRLLAIADDRIALAADVLKDEAENYSFGKVTLNDYIQAVNSLDTNRFNKISHEVLYRKLIVEWLRLTDSLITRDGP